MLTRSYLSVYINLNPLFCSLFYILRKLKRCISNAGGSELDRVSECETPNKRRLQNRVRFVAFVYFQQK